jgi:hypothetical protein
MVADGGTDGSNVLLARIIVGGKFKEQKTGTLVLVLESSTRKTKIKVMEGENKGDTAWLFSENVMPIQAEAQATPQPAITP